MPLLLSPAAPESTEPDAALEALFREARARQRRRRLLLAGATLALTAAAGIAYVVLRATTTAKGTLDLPGGGMVNVQAFAHRGRLAFVSRGRLFVLDGTSRRVVPVTGPGAGASDPRFSPDGRYVLYGLGARFGIARADGTAPRVYRGSASWLPDGELLRGRFVDRVAAGGTLVRVGRAPVGLAAWAPDGSRFAFVSSQLVRRQDGTMTGVERLEVADSLHGRRTLWYRLPQRFTPKDGFTTSNLGGVVVLPGRKGLLVSLDPFHSSSYAADGLSVFELTAPGARLRKLGVTIGERVSLGAGGQLAIGAGPNRYAWLTKTAETCSVATARCTAVPGRLTLDPAWSPDGRLLAFVAAAPGTAGDFRQSTIERWYATRRLRLLRAGTARPIDVPGSGGAATPVWSRDGKSILYVAGDGLWLLPRLDARPVEVASPLFSPKHWPSYYGEIGWTSRFAWWSGP